MEPDVPGLLVIDPSLSGGMASAGQEALGVTVVDDRAVRRHVRVIASCSATSGGMSRTEMWYPIVASIGAS